MAEPVSRSNKVIGDVTVDIRGFHCILGRLS